MKNRLFVYFIIGLWLVNPCLAQAQTRHHSSGRNLQAAPMQQGRYSDIVIDVSTGRILHATNADSLRHPASLAKIMTLYLTFQALQDGRLQLDQQLPVSVKAANQAATKLGLQSGQTISVRNAIMSLVTQSANDSAVVLAEALSGDEASFGLLMTQQAAALGMTHTHFYNASGLPDPNQITTAADMATLGCALLQHFPQFYSYFSVDQFTYAGNHYHNHNHLMDRYPGMDGIKTGYVQASGFNLVASAKRGNVRLIGVVFGGSSPVARDQRMAQLLDESFDMVQRGTLPSAANGQTSAAQSDATAG